jgi:hypothetical protein
LQAFLATGWPETIFLASVLFVFGLLVAALLGCGLWWAGFGVAGFAFAGCRISRFSRFIVVGQLLQL